MSSKGSIPRPLFAKDVEIAQLERTIRQNVERLAELAPSERLTFYWQQLTNLLRTQGAILPGDGRGGLIHPKGNLPSVPVQEGD